MLDERIRSLVDGPNFAVITTLLPDGMPMTHVMWVSFLDGHLLMNTEVHRQKFKNVTRDPRVVVTVWDREDNYRYGEVRGRVVGTVTGDEARAHIDELSRKYLGHDYATRVQSERVILKIEPDRQRFHG